MFSLRLRLFPSTIKSQEPLKISKRANKKKGRPAILFPIIHYEEKHNQDKL